MPVINILLIRRVTSLAARLNLWWQRYFSTDPFWVSGPDFRVSHTPPRILLGTPDWTATVYHQVLP